jgi:hypothetical protein
MVTSPILKRRRPRQVAIAQSSDIEDGLRTLLNHFIGKQGLLMAAEQAVTIPWQYCLLYLGKLDIVKYYGHVYALSRLIEHGN